MPDDDWQVAAWAGTDDDSSLLDSNSITMPADEHVVDVSYTGPVTIYGNAGIEGVTLSYEKDGSVFFAVTDADGNYVITVPLNWSGVVTPSKTDYVFSPESKTYTALGEDLLEQNYAAFDNIYFAKPGGVTSGSCRSWAQACELQYALLHAAPGYEIWVAAGIYVPGTLTTDTFQLKSGVALYGGFTGVETARDQRNPAANITILSGDLAQDDLPNYGNRIDNSYHVVTGSGTDDTARLDGFTISGGYAGGSIPDNSGGGMLNISGSPALNDLIFTGNVARAGGGGGMYNENSNPVISNIVFDSNLAEKHSGWGGWGGGMYNVTSSPSLRNVTFRDNLARSLADWSSGWGGGLYNFQSSPALTNVTFYGNQANSGGGLYNHQSSPVLTNTTFSGNAANLTPGWSGGAGGGIYNYDSDPEIRNTILWGNTAVEGPQLYNDPDSTPVLHYSILETGCPAGSTCQNIVLTDPLLGEIGSSGFAQAIPIGSGGSAIDTGSNTFCPETDQRGKNRPDDGNADDIFVCDIGAFEQELALDVLSVTRTGSSPTDTANVSFIVSFSKPVTGVDVSAPFEDFDLATTGRISGASVSAVSGSGRTYTVTVDTGSGNGTIRLDVVDDDSIRDAANNGLGGPGAGNGVFDAGEFYTIASPVSKPVLVLPARNYLTNNSEPAFTWSDVVNADHYEIQFAADSAFAQDLDPHFTIDAAPAFEATAPLDDGRYYWRVRAYNIVNQPGPWSASRYFTVDTTLPAVPSSTAPVSGTSLKGVPTFRWKAVSGAVLYQFQIDDDPNFLSPLYTIDQRLTSRRLPGGVRGTYYWRVRARDAAGNWSDWSPVSTVTLLPPR